jgi:hypothetical protein
MAKEREQEQEANGLGAVEAALARGGKVYDKPEDFNMALDHVAGLLEDATVLFAMGLVSSQAR